MAKKQERKYMILSQVTATELAQNLANFTSYEDVIELIRDINRYHGDSVFTEMLLDLTDELGEELYSG